MLSGESLFHISTPLGIEPRSLMPGSKQVDHWTSGTVYDCSEIAGSPQAGFKTPILNNNIRKRYHPEMAKSISSSWEIGNYKRYWKHQNSHCGTSYPWRIYQLGPVLHNRRI
jgi:hypothetical protein